ncbi:MAG: hypothetical protein ACK4RN_15645 [Pseudorhodobacter sp.]
MTGPEPAGRLTAETGNRSGEKIAILGLARPCATPGRTSGGTSAGTGPDPAAPPQLRWLCDIGQARDFLAEDQDSLVLLLPVHPVRDLAARLRSGTALPEAIISCEAGLRALLEFFRTDRQRVRIAERSPALQNPAALAQAVTAVCGGGWAEAGGGETPLETLLRASLPPGTEEEEIPEAYHAFARLGLAERPDLRRLLNEFEAALLPLRPRGENRPAWQDGIGQLLRLEAEAAKARDLADLDRRHAALRADFEAVARVESTMTLRNLALLHEIAGLEAAHEAALADLARSQDHAAEKERRLAALEESLARLRDLAAGRARRVLELEAALEAAQGRGTAAAQQVADLEQTLARMRGEAAGQARQVVELEEALSAARQGTQDREAAAARQIAGLEQALTAARQEAHDREAAGARQIAGLEQGLATARQEARDRAAASERQAAALRQDLARARSKITAATEQAALLKSQNEALLASTSWRITAPVRALKSLFRPANRG